MTTAYSPFLQRVTGTMVLFIVGVLCLFSLYQPEKRIETRIQAVPKAPAIVSQVEVLPKSEIHTMPKLAPKAQVTSKVVAKPKKVVTQVQTQWWVQLATFIQKENAQQLVKRLQRDGQSAELNRTTRSRDQRQYYRVLIGPIKTKQQALALNQQLAQQYTMQGMVIRKSSP